MNLILNVLGVLAGVGLLYMRVVSTLTKKSIKDTDYTYIKEYMRHSKKKSFGRLTTIALIVVALMVLVTTNYQNPFLPWLFFCALASNEISEYRLTRWNHDKFGRWLKKIDW